MNFSEIQISGDFEQYVSRLSAIMAQADFASVASLAKCMRDCWADGGCVYICGNGGSAGNAIHLANDFLYGISRNDGMGMRVHALSANSSIITCLANDLDYTEIYSAQLRVMAKANDILIVLSGSGNSPNIIKALDVGKDLNMQTFAILGYSGGMAKQVADTSIHFEVDDMQIAEDTQLIVGHMIMQWLCKNPPN